ncbi:ankyrin 2,3/unc44 [Vibrio sp. JCM 19236]|nr:ankyrin 2,3/unc44 [Vibrio sp. JCM 19236]
MMVAARDGQVESLKTLMELGGDQSIPDHYMKAIPLHKAAYNGHPEIIELLSRFSGFKETLDAQGPNNGYTPLHDAIWHGHTQAAANLINAGARTDLRGFDGKTPLELAKEYQYTSIVEMLEKK